MAVSLDDHSLERLDIVDDGSEAECVCGWSTLARTSLDAGREWRDHVEQMHTGRAA